MPCTPCACRLSTSRFFLFQETERPVWVSFTQGGLEVPDLPPLPERGSGLTQWVCAALKPWATLCHVNASPALLCLTATG